MIEQHNKINKKNEVEFNKIINQPQSNYLENLCIGAIKSNLQDNLN